MELLKAPKSRFVKVKCSKCNAEQIIFDKASTVVKCIGCGEILARPSGGKAKLESRVVEVI
ncbi:MAG: 30S ribosomal protein S27e [Candidatus Nanoarchaeia archaeon]|nr:30S ribosomal protein S27e [Candidatus Nanoarchaeia archaeon]